MSGAPRTTQAPDRIRTILGLGRRTDGGRHPRRRISVDGCLSGEVAAEDFLLKPIIEEGRLHTLTGPTGTGKTAIALLIALHIAIGKPLGAARSGRPACCSWRAKPRRRADAMADHVAAAAARPPEEVDVRFVEGRFGIAEHFDVVARHMEERPAGLVIPDTLQAFFSGDDSNSNDQMKEAAETFRGIASLGPAVMIPAHPVKGATRDRNVPYGGGALLNEVDGNLSLWGPPDAVELSWCGKFRGAFEPLNFALDVGNVPDAVRQRRRPYQDRHRAHPERGRSRGRRGRQIYQDLRGSARGHPRKSGRQCPEVGRRLRTYGEFGWSKSNTGRRLLALKEKGLAELLLGRWALTATGKRALENT